MPIFIEFLPHEDINDITPKQAQQAKQFSRMLLWRLIKLCHNNVCNLATLLSTNSIKRFHYHKDSQCVHGSLTASVRSSWHLSIRVSSFRSWHTTWTRPSDPIDRLAVSCNKYHHKTSNKKSPQIVGLRPPMCWIYFFFLPANFNANPLNIFWCICNYHDFTIPINSKCCSICYRLVVI